MLRSWKAADRNCKIGLQRNSEGQLKTIIQLLGSMHRIIQFSILREWTKKAEEAMGGAPAGLKEAVEEAVAAAESQVDAMVE